MSKTEPATDWTPEYTHRPPDFSSTRGGKKPSTLRQAIDGLGVGQFFQAPPEPDKKAAHLRSQVIFCARKAYPTWTITVGRDAAGNLWIGRDR